MGDKYLTAERGYIYEWENSNNEGHTNYCVVVSSPRRCKDNLISILFLSTDRGVIADDLIRVRFNHTDYVVRTDLVTYTKRAYLKRKVMNVQSNIMEDIDNGIAMSMGLKGSTAIDWEAMYNSLLENMIRRNINE